VIEYHGCAGPFLNLISDTESSRAVGYLPEAIRRNPGKIAANSSSVFMSFAAFFERGRLSASS
jgi:hypothetical protein